MNFIDCYHSLASRPCHDGKCLCVCGSRGGQKRASVTLGGASYRMGQRSDGFFGHFRRMRGGGAPVGLRRGLRRWMGGVETGGVGRQMAERSRLVVQLKWPTRRGKALELIHGARVQRPHLPRSIRDMSFSMIDALILQVIYLPDRWR